LLPFGEVLLAGAEDVPDPVERVVAAAAVPGGVLLNPAADVIDDGAGELDDVERSSPAMASSSWSSMAFL